MISFLDSPVFTWGILPLAIFCARITDVSIGTMRIIMIGHGRRSVAAFLGFFEVSIWLLVARQVIMHLPNQACFFAYAGGFAMGNFVGMWIEEHFSSGVQLIRLIINQPVEPILQVLKEQGYGFTSINGQGAKGPVNVLFTIVDRRRSRDVIALVKDLTPKVFYTIEDIRHLSEGVFPPARRNFIETFFKRK